MDNQSQNIITKVRHNDLSYNDTHSIFFELITNTYNTIIRDEIILDLSFNYVISHKINRSVRHLRPRFF